MELIHAGKPLDDRRAKRAHKSAHRCAAARFGSRILLPHARTRALHCCIHTRLRAYNQSGWRRQPLSAFRRSATAAAAQNKQRYVDRHVGWRQRTGMVSDGFFANTRSAETDLLSKYAFSASAPPHGRQCVNRRHGERRNNSRSTGNKREKKKKKALKGAVIQ